VGTISQLEQTTPAAVAAPVEAAHTYVHETGAGAPYVRMGGIGCVSAPCNDRVSAPPSMALRHTSASPARCGSLAGSTAAARAPRRDARPSPGTEFHHRLPGRFGPTPCAASVSGGAWRAAAHPGGLTRGDFL